MRENLAAGTSEKKRPTTRYSELKRMLEDRQREIQAEVQGKMRDVRSEGTWGGKLNEVLDAVESSSTSRGSSRSLMARAGRAADARRGH